MYGNMKNFKYFCKTINVKYAKNFHIRKRFFRDCLSSKI